MSWMQKLYETYDACAGSEPDGSEKLMPICHTTQQAQIEVVLDNEGNFKRARVIHKDESTTLIPCTEGSGGRSGSAPVNHPLCDKLQYVAGDYLKFGGEVTSGFAKDKEAPFKSFVSDMRAWANSEFCSPKLKSILKYVERKCLIEDLVKENILPIDEHRRLLHIWSGQKDSMPPIFKVIQNTQSPQDAFVRWQVEEAQDVASGTWQDSSLIEGWINYYKSFQSKQGSCVATGLKTSLAIQHPAKLRNGGDKAKLISANDSSGYTFRGRFLDEEQAISVGFEFTQKAHNALRWLIVRQGYKNAEQAIVSWTVSGKPLPPVYANTFDLLGIKPSFELSQATEDAGQHFALNLKNALAGYKAKLDSNDDTVVIALDSATPGRMSITFYRELRGSEFLNRIESWHTKIAWRQNFSKEVKFIGAPSPKEIAEAAFGKRLDEKLRKATVERLLPCIVDGRDIPYDLVLSTTKRAANRVGLDNWEWEKYLGIACGLYKGFYTQRKYQMTLETNRITRDYLYGRLLAVADQIEGRALFLAGERRDTMAARLMQRFSDRPFSTWKTIELALAPYKSRLRNSRGAFLNEMEKLIDDVMSVFDSADFSRDTSLSGEFLLGYHCQRHALRPVSKDEENSKS